MGAIDWVMSLETHWFSTVFGAPRARRRHPRKPVPHRDLRRVPRDEAALARNHGATPARPRQPPPRVHDALGLSRVHAVPDHLVREPAEESAGTSAGSHGGMAERRAVARSSFHFAVPFFLLLSRAAKRSPRCSRRSPRAARDARRGPRLDDRAVASVAGSRPASCSTSRRSSRSAARGWRSSCGGCARRPFLGSRRRDGGGAWRSSTSWLPEKAPPCLAGRATDAATRSTTCGSPRSCRSRSARGRDRGRVARRCDVSLAVRPAPRASPPRARRGYGEQFRRSRGSRPTPAADLAALRAPAKRAARRWGWIDREAGVARIPIERARALLAEAAVELRRGGPACARNEEAPMSARPRRAAAASPRSRAGAPPTTRRPRLRPRRSKSRRPAARRPGAARRAVPRRDGRPSRWATSSREEAARARVGLLSMSDALRAWS